MRKMMSAATVAGLAVIGLALPGAVAQATPASTCTYKEDGMVHAWRYANCTGDHLGQAEGDDWNWGDNTGPFQGDDDNRASSVMNSGRNDTNGYNYVAFYRLPGNPANTWSSGYICMDRGDWVVDLANERFTTGQVVDDSISAHAWVKGSACSKFMG
ncbi:hypothetical protein ACFYZN_02730 [Streptomyces sp. NPDC001777]|uniref:hypothetical protein n=1 Tax=Streptomyces sp. NPDC001777 TaxID=3364608 RepID=UPI0036BCFD0E